jgi:hypothetical protein
VLYEQELIYSARFNCSRSTLRQQQIMTGLAGPLLFSSIEEKTLLPAGAVTTSSWVRFGDGLETR